MRISKVKGLRPWQMEKHYLMAIILNLLSDYNLVFKGGTYLWFFHGLPRFSEDLDFTATGRIPTDLAQKVSDGVKIYGTENELKVITDNSTTFSFRIIANGPLNTSIKDRCVVYVEISKRENVIQDRFPLKMDFPEYSIPVKRISGMNLDEVGSEKVRAILTRKKGRDIFDLYFLIDSKKILFNQDLINLKLDFYRMNFSTFLFVNEVKSRAQRFEKDLKNLVFNKLPDYESIMEKIERWIQVQNTP